MTCATGSFTAGVSDPSVVVDTSDYSAAYERLRACVMGQSGTRAAGLGLVLLEGLPGWLDAMARARAASSGSPRISVTSRPRDRRCEMQQCATPMPIASEVLPLPEQVDLTRILANLVLSKQQGRMANALAAQNRILRRIA